MARLKQSLLFSVANGLAVIGAFACMFLLGVFCAALILAKRLAGKLIRELRRGGWFIRGRAAS